MDAPSSARSEVSVCRISLDPGPFGAISGLFQTTVGLCSNFPPGNLPVLSWERGKLDPCFGALPMAPALGNHPSEATRFRSPEPYSSDQTRSRRRAPLQRRPCPRRGPRRRKKKRRKPPEGVVQDEDPLCLCDFCVVFQKWKQRTEENQPDHREARSKRKAVDFTNSSLASIAL